MTYHRGTSAHIRWKYEETPKEEASAAESVPADKLPKETEKPQPTQFPGDDSLHDICAAYTRAVHWVIARPEYATQSVILRCERCGRSTTLSEAWLRSTNGLPDGFIAYHSHCDDA